jgi:hypothetical protein
MAGFMDEECQNLACVNGKFTPGKCYNWKDPSWTGKKVVCANIDNSLKTADKGHRVLPKKFDLDHILAKRILGTDGISKTTPCPPGTMGLDCKPCAVGYWKESFIHSICQPCDLLDLRHFTSHNNCNEFLCNTKIVLISQDINPACLTFEKIAYNLINDTILWFGITEGSLLAIVIALLIAQNLKGDKNWVFTKKWKQTEMSEHTPKYQCCPEKTKTGDRRRTTIRETSQAVPVKICFVGSNKPINQWFLEKNFSREFEDVYKNTFPRQNTVFGDIPEKEELKIWVKSINQACKWKVSFLIGYYLSKLLPWPLNDYARKYLRKKIANRVKKQIDEINQSR